MTTKTVLQIILKGLLHTEEEDKHNHRNKGRTKSHYTCRQQMRRKNQILQTNKMAGITTYLSIITLNANDLNSLIKRHRLAHWITKQEPSMFCL
jgi:hypothetical protein